MRPPSINRKSTESETHRPSSKLTPDSKLTPNSKLTPDLLAIEPSLEIHQAWQLPPRIAGPLNVETLWPADSSSALAVLGKPQSLQVSTHGYSIGSLASSVCSIITSSHLAVSLLTLLDPE